MKSAEAFLKALSSVAQPGGDVELAPIEPKPNGFAEVDALSQQLESRAIYLLGVREHGAKELKAKLVSKFPETPTLLVFYDALPGLVESLIDDVLQRCQENDWQSDERYIEQAVRNWVAKGSGPVKIRQKLQQASHRGDLITMYLDGDDSEWLALAVVALVKKYGSAEKPKIHNTQAKRMRFLQSRGFTPNIIRQVFR